jgi:hypothetical protein
VGGPAPLAPTRRGAAVATLAAILSYIDGFLAVAIGAYACLFLTAFLRRH